MSLLRQLKVGAWEQLLVAELVEPEQAVGVQRCHLLLCTDQRQFGRWPHHQLVLPSLQRPRQPLASPAHLPGHRRSVPHQTCRSPSGAHPCSLGDLRRVLPSQRWTLSGEDP